MPLKSFRAFLTEGSAIQDITKSAVKIGERRGTNEGGEYLLNGKEHHYVKFYRDPQQAVSEVAAAHVYDKIGVPTMKPFLVKHGGKTGVASKWQEGLQGVGRNPDYNSWSEEDKHQLAKHYVAAVVTKNWDAIGLVHDNIAKDKGGKLVNNDLGGVFRFRAQGGPKPFGDDIDEAQSLRNPKLPSGKAFTALGDHHINGAIKSLKSLDRNEMASHFKSLGLADADAHADAIHGRAQRMLRMIQE